MPRIKSTSSNTPNYPGTRWHVLRPHHRTSVWSEEFHLCSQGETGPYSKATRSACRQSLHSAILSGSSELSHLPGCQGHVRLRLRRDASIATSGATVVLPPGGEIPNASSERMHDEWPVLACWSGTIKVRRSLSAIGRPHTSHSGTGAWLLPTRTSLTADRQKN